MTSPDTPMIEWLRYPAAEAYVAVKLDEFVAAVPLARSLQTDLILHTSSRLVDWLDHLVLADGDAPRGQLADLGFELVEVPSAPGDKVYQHPGALFPAIVLRRETGLKPGDGSAESPRSVVAAAIQVEDVFEFLMTHHVPAAIEGTSLSPYRRARVTAGDRREFFVVERRGHEGLPPVEMPPDYAQRYLGAFERWATRPRELSDAREGMRQTLALARSLVSELGTDRAAWVAFAAERAYWQRRNQAGQVQKGRQDHLGVGWANHDHHTFRSSREVFTI